MRWDRLHRPAVLTLLLVAAASALALAVDSTPSALEREPAGWTDLFAAATPDLKGWTRVAIPPTAALGAKSQWKFDSASGNLVCEGNGGHEWVRWDQELGDFVYHVEWRFVPVEGAKKYNSGLYARNSADGKIWHQAQTGDGSGGYIFGDTLVGGEPKRVNLSKAMLDKRVKPAGEWNTFEVTCRGKTMSLWVNGAVTIEWKDCEVAKGFVGLEAEGWKIEFRNVKVKPL